MRHAKFTWKRRRISIFPMNYRLLIFGLLLGGFVIIGASVYIGYVVRDGEVVDNAYEAGLKFDEVAKRRQELGWNVELPRSLHVGKEESAVVTVMVTDRTGSGLNDATVDIDLNRMGNRHIRTFHCVADKAGRYSVPVHFDAPGYWEARVHVARLQDALIFDDHINVVR